MSDKKIVSSDFILPKLGDNLLGDSGEIIHTPSGGAGWQSVKPGYKAFTLPDGTQVIMDKDGNIIK